jgi:hypothetical protein
VVNAYPGYSGNALEIYGSLAIPRLTPAILEERREALRVAFAEGPHESQVHWRRDDRWARRWPALCWCWWAAAFARHPQGHQFALQTTAALPCFAFPDALGCLAAIPTGLVNVGCEQEKHCALCGTLSQWEFFEDRVPHNAQCFS